jgi:ATP-dependent protease ClpP protease subunit
VFAEEEKQEKGICPKTKMTESCLSCHIAPSFKLKETTLDAHLQYPDGMKFLNYPNNPIGYLTVGEIDSGISDRVWRAFEYCKKHQVKYMILDVHSFGGGVFEAWRIKSFIDEFVAEGGIVETRLRGMALSAGAIVFVAGTKGYRIANCQSEFMLHELGLYKGGLFYIEKVTPSSAEEEANILKHLQKTITDWFATRGNLSVKELEAKIKMKEFWLSGREAYECGFVDKLIGE